MDLKQVAILISGVSSVVLVVLCPLWVYPSHPLVSPERSTGYRFITNPPKPLPVVGMEKGLPVINTNNVEVVVARIDRADLSARLVLIIAITAWGLWVVRRLHRIENRRKHRILVILATFGLLLAANIHTSGYTN